MAGTQPALVVMVVAAGVHLGVVVGLLVAAGVPCHVGVAVGAVHMAAGEHEVIPVGAGCRHPVVGALAAS